MECNKEVKKGVSWTDVYSLTGVRDIIFPRSKG